MGNISEEEHRQYDVEELVNEASQEHNDAYWVRLAKSAYDTSTDYLDSNIRKEWEVSIAHHNSEHSSDTKYASANYKGRSKTFRPKTRSNNINAEAAFAKAMFSTSDYIDVQPQNPNSEVQQISASVNKAILQYRLEKSIKWYLTAMGAYQDARVQGGCFSYQAWEYEEDEDGTVIHDRPICNLLPPENLRLEPNCDWRDPINTSPYVIRLVPMYGSEILSKAKAMGFREDINLAQLIGAGQNDGQKEDSTRRARNGQNREDPNQQLDGEANEFTLCWLHENFIRVGHEDVVFWTCGTSLLLKDPVPVIEAYPHLKRDERPITFGSLLVESHKTYPTSPTYIIAPLQKDVNDVANQRFDNVRLVLNKRYVVRRGQTGIDVAALARSVPGGSVYANDPDKDIRELSYSDVTGSSYVEQDRLDVAIDELSGMFSQQSVQSNRNLNETVGGMNLMQAGASDVQEYMLLNIIKTWVSATLSQLVRLEQYYENDQTILALAFESAEEYTEEVYQRFNQADALDHILRQDLTVSVSAGFGAVNPQQKIERMNLGLQTVSGLPTALMRVDEDEVIKEVFGALGYRDGKKFFKPAGEFEQQMSGQQPPTDPLAEGKLALEQQRLEFEQQKFMAESELSREKMMLDIEAKKEIEMMKLAHSEGLKLAELENRLGIERERIQTQRQVEAGRQALDQAKMALEAENLSAGYDTF